MTVILEKSSTAIDPIIEAWNINILPKLVKEMASSLFTRSVNSQVLDEDILVMPGIARSFLLATVPMHF